MGRSFGRRVNKLGGQKLEATDEKGVIQCRGREFIQFHDLILQCEGHASKF